jgi:RNA polymerase sigma-70 factor (ECF subfamily)
MTLAAVAPSSPTPLLSALAVRAWRLERAAVRRTAPVCYPMFMAESLTLRSIYDEHADFVWRSLRRLGVSEADVPDATQEVFLVVHRRLAEFEGRSKITTWLYGIALRVASDRRKQAWERRRASDDASIDQAADPAHDAGLELERRQGLALLERILDDLPLEQRAVFTLFELDGLTGDAISELLEIPLGTVYSRLRLARETFAKTAARLRAVDERRTRSPHPPDRPSAERLRAEEPRPLLAGGRR